MADSKKLLHEELADTITGRCMNAPLALGVQEIVKVAVKEAIRRAAAQCKEEEAKATEVLARYKDEDIGREWWAGVEDAAETIGKRILALIGEEMK